MGERRRVKARKPHRCSLCDGRIEQGERHVYARITPWDHPDNDSFGDYRAHVMCDEVWRDIGHEYEWTFPDAWQFRDALAEAGRSTEQHSSPPPPQTREGQHG